MLSADAAEVGAGASTRVSKSDFSVAGSGAMRGGCATGGGATGGGAGCGATCWGAAGAADGGTAGEVDGTSSGSGAEGSEGRAPGGPAGLPEETDAGSGGGSACAFASAELRQRASTRPVPRNEGMEVLRWEDGEGSGETTLETSSAATARPGLPGATTVAGRAPAS